MSRCTQIVAQIVTAAAFLSSAAHLQASSSTAYVSVCCNAPSTAGVFSASTLKQTRTIVTGSRGDGLALSPDGTKMFVTVDYKRELQVIETATGAILATVPVPISISGEPPIELAISPDGSHVYVFAPQASTTTGSVLFAVDTTTYSITASANPPALGSLGPLLVSPDGTQLYYEVGYANEYIQVVDAATLALVKQIPANGYPTDLAVTPSGLILMPDSNNQLLVIDPATSVVTTFTLPNNNQGTPGIVISSPDSTTAYISSATGSILAVNIATGATAFFAVVSYIPTHFAISPDGSTLYSTNLSHSDVWSLSEFSIPTQQPLKSERQLGPITGLALTQDGQSLYVLNANESAIVAVDIQSEKVTHVVLGGAGIGTLAIPPNSDIVWASDFSSGLGGDTLFLNPATWQVKYVVDFSGAFVFNSTGTVAYVYNSGNVTGYDVATMTPIGTAYAGQLTNIGQALLSPDGTRLYINVNFISGVVDNGPVEFGPGAIYVLDTSTFKYVASFSVPYGLGAMALTPDGSTLVYTANFGRVQLLSTATLKITATVQLTPTNGLLADVALSPDGSTAYVTDALNNSLLVANLQTLTQVGSIAVGTSPSPVVISPDGSEAWVATLSGLEIVKLATGEVSAVALPGEPADIVFAP